MASKLLIFLAGLVAGAGLALWGMRTGSVPSAHAVLESTATAELTALGEEFDRVSARIAELEVEKLDLAEELGALKAQTALPPAPAPVRQGSVRANLDNLHRDAIAQANRATNSARTAMKEMMRSTLQQQIEGKLENMQSRLQLTPEQLGQARAILERQFDVQSAMAEKVLSGESSAAELARQGEDLGNPEEQLLALMTPVQQEGYAELQKEERRASARLMANSELLQMQTALGLSEDQQDAVFRAIYSETERQFGGTGTGAPGQPMDFRGNLERKLQALQGVLTPEQYERYQRIQEQQLKLMETLLPRDGQPGDVAIPNVQLLPQP